jgi:hypothetical protein
VKKELVNMVGFVFQILEVSWHMWIMFLGQMTGIAGKYLQ